MNNKQDESKKEDVVRLVIVNESLLQRIIGSIIFHMVITTILDLIIAWYFF